MANLARTPRALAPHADIGAQVLAFHGKAGEWRPPGENHVSPDPGIRKGRKSCGSLLARALLDVPAAGWQEGVDLLPLRTRRERDEEEAFGMSQSLE